MGETTVPRFGFAWAPKSDLSPSSPSWIGSEILPHGYEIMPQIFLLSYFRGEQLSTELSKKIVCSDRAPPSAFTFSFAFLSLSLSPSSHQHHHSLPKVPPLSAVSSSSSLWSANALNVSWKVGISLFMTYTLVTNSNFPVEMSLIIAVLILFDHLITPSGCTIQHHRCDCLQYT